MCPHRSPKASGQEDRKRFLFARSTDCHPAAAGPANTPAKTKPGRNAETSFLTGVFIVMPRIDKELTCVVIPLTRRCRLPTAFAALNVGHAKSNHPERREK